MAVETIAPQPRPSGRGARQDVIELSKQGYFTILLDENLLGLETGLEDDGFKVIALQPGEPSRDGQGRANEKSLGPARRHTLRLGWFQRPPGMCPAPQPRS